MAIGLKQMCTKSHSLYARACIFHVIF